jgi:shikimate 5-dehydrogenase
VAPLAEVLPLLLARRGQAVPEAWKPHAFCIDIELGELGKEEADLVSLHAASPMQPQEVLALWQKVPEGLGCKHVEPVGALETAPRLLETQRLLSQLRAEEQTTVLAMGEVALPFRCLLAPQNSLDYVALSAHWQATWQNTPGQRLLADAVREARRPRPRAGCLLPLPPPPRMGIVGSRIAHARSPSIHPQPFDRIELPEDADIEALLQTLRPFYAGFAVTSPFKRALAKGSLWPAVNTLVRTPEGWHKDNTDVAGARAVLQALEEEEVTVLGQGGVAIALEEAAKQLGISLRFVVAKEAKGHVQGAVVWTWPTHVQPPPGLRLDGARVALIAYGKPAWALAEKIAALGGKPCMLGATWFVAQARGQRRLWENAQ